jgi:hypothetical protein
MPALNIFVSYSHENDVWVREDYDHSLIPFLARQLQVDGVQFQFDPELKNLPGVKYLERIREWIDQAHCVILLISQEFLHSEFILKHELPRIRERHNNKEISIIPILVGNVDWEEKGLQWISDLQMLPGKPDPLINYIQDAAKWDRVKVEILIAIRNRIRDLQKDRQPIQVPDVPKPLINNSTKPWPKLNTKIRNIFVALILALVIIAVSAFFIFRKHPSPSPPTAVSTAALGFSKYWQPQTHPDCRAVYGIHPLPDGQTIEIQANFKPGYQPFMQGEAIIYFTQGAEKPGDTTTLQLTELSMDIAAHPDIDVRFYLKDSAWGSAYWDLIKAGTTEWQHISLNTETTAPSWESQGFDGNKVVALGWQFLSQSFAGPTQFQIRNVQIKFRPTNLLPPIERWPHAQFIQQCGIDMTRIFGDHDFGKTIQGSVHQGVSTQLPELKERLDYLASKRVGLIWVSIFRDLSDGLLLDQDQKIASLDPSVYSDMDALIAEVAKHPGMQLLPVLFESQVAQRWRQLIINQADRRFFCNAILLPFLARYAASPQIYGMEVLADPEKMSLIVNDEATREFVGEILKVIREVHPKWKAMTGFGSRASMNHFMFSGFDAFTFYYDANNQNYEFIKARRDQIQFPPRGVPLIIIARFPNLTPQDPAGESMAFAAHAIQDVYDYGYAGIIFSSLDKRIPFEGREADAFADWMK